MCRFYVKPQSLISISKDLYESLYILQSERSQLETIASSLDSVFEDQKRDLIYLIQELDNGKMNPWNS